MTRDRMATYAAAREYAQRDADITGFDQGLEWNPIFGDWSHRSLPCKRNRYGHELQVEVVHPTDLAKCRPGHGPLSGEIVTDFPT